MAALTRQEKLILRFLSGVIIAGLAVGIYRNYRGYDVQLHAELENAAENFQTQAGRISATVANLPEMAADTAAPEPETPALVNINTASKDQLVTLPKIGPVVAERIIRYRLDVGNFQSVEDLKNIRGIGDKTLDQLRPLITL